MQKNISIRRRAQNLAKGGQIAKAIEAYKPLLTSSAVDPYDYLYVGDLHEKLGQREEAITYYESAIREYSKLGFHRNGIALCRKILRLKPSHLEIYRHLGYLYAAEELVGDALGAYLIYLDGASAEQQAEEGFREVISRATEIAPGQSELALRLSQTLQTLGRLDEAAELLMRTSEVVRRAGDQESAEELKDLAEGIDPEAAQRAAAIIQQAAGETAVARPEAGAEIPVGPHEEQALAEVTAIAGVSEAGNPGVERVLELPDGLEIGGDLEAGAEPAVPEESHGDTELVLEPDFEASVPTSPEADTQADVPDGDGAGATPSLGIEANESTFGDITFDIGADEETKEEEDSAEQDHPPADPESPQEASVEGASETSPSASSSHSGRFPSGSMEIEIEELPAGHLADPARATREAMDGEQWVSAQKRAEEWIQHDPLSIEAVEKLIEISETLQDNPSIVRGLILKGDLLIRDGDLHQALPVFKCVLDIDAQNITARRRMNRFHDLGIEGAEIPHRSWGAREGDGAVVAVREDDDRGEGQQDWMEIGALLEEFRAGLKQQVGANDVQAHYDLGVSHLEMGLSEEAIEEFDAALSCDGLSPKLKLRLRELRGKCLAGLQRHREAMHEFRQALEIEEVDLQQRAELKYLLAIEHESVGEGDEAKECLREVLRIRPGFKEAAQRLSSLEGEAA